MFEIGDIASTSAAWPIQTPAEAARAPSRRDVDDHRHLRGELLLVDRPHRVREAAGRVEQDHDRVVAGARGVVDLALEVVGRRRADVERELHREHARAVPGSRCRRRPGSRRGGRRPPRRARPKIPARSPISQRGNCSSVGTAGRAPNSVSRHHSERSKARGRDESLSGRTARAPRRPVGRRGTRGARRRDDRVARAAGRGRADACLDAARPGGSTSSACAGGDRARCASGHASLSGRWSAWQAPDDTNPTWTGAADALAVPRARARVPAARVLHLEPGRARVAAPPRGGGLAADRLADCVGRERAPAPEPAALRAGGPVRRSSTTRRRRTTTRPTRPPRSCAGSTSTT